MKTMRKTIAVLLTIAMAFSLCGVVSFAATAEDVWQYGTYTSPRPAGCREAFL